MTAATEGQINRPQKIAASRGARVQGCFFSSRAVRLRFAVFGKAVGRLRVVQIVFIPGTRPELLSDRSPKGPKKARTQPAAHRPTPATNLHIVVYGWQDTPPKIMWRIVIPDVGLPNGRHTTLRPPWAGGRSAPMSAAIGKGQDRFGEARGSPPRLIAIITACVSLTHPKLPAPSDRSPGASYSVQEGC